MNYCHGDLVDIFNGTSNKRYCTFDDPIYVTSTTITVKFITDSLLTASGFFAVVTGDATVTTDVTGESGVGDMYH